MKTKHLRSFQITVFHYTLLPAMLLFIFFASNLQAQTIGNSATGSTTYPTTTVGDNATRTGTVSNTVNIVQAANKFTVTGPMTITSFSIYLSGSYNGNSMKFAVYPDNAGTPVGQTLTGQTGGYTFTTATGWVTFALNSSDYIYLPAAGTYWLCFMGNASGGQVRRLGTQVDYYFTQTYGSGYPTTFPNATAENAGTYSFYATGVQIKGYSKATKAVLPANGSFSSLSFYSHAAGNARLAIFNDASGSPSAKQWESGEISITATGLPKWTTVNISNGTPSSLNLNAGTYWLAWQWNSTAGGPSYTAGAAGDGNRMIQSTYGAYPASWSGGTITTEKWSIYATYCIPPAAPAVTSPVKYCLNETAAALTASGTGLLWYTDPTFGTGSSAAPIPTTAELGTTSYYVSQTIGCEGPRAQIDVIVSANPSASVSGQTNISCNAGNDGTITILASGGTGSYSYSVDNGTSWKASATNPYPYSGLYANTAYRIKVKDSNGCISK